MYKTLNSVAYLTGPSVTSGAADIVSKSEDHQS